MPLIESRKGISPLRSDGTVLELKIDEVKVSLHTALLSINQTNIIIFRNVSLKYVRINNILVIDCDFV